MTEKEFRKLSRAQYLEMMVEQGREIKRLKEELELAREEIKQKEIKIRKILFAVQKIEEELEEKEQNKENDIEIEKKTKKDK